MKILASWQTALVLTVSLVLSACALSPQTVVLTPVVTVAADDNIGQNRALHVSGEDLRGDAVIGSRGSVYADQSLIQADGDVVGALTSQVRRHLQARGFNTLNAVDEDAPTLTVQLEALDYLPAEGYVVNRVVVEATLKAQVEDLDGVYSRTYHSHVAYKQPFTPAASKNEAMLNDVLSRTLDKLLSDAALLERLSR